MTEQTFRVTVRGFFAGLTPEQRQALRDDADAHSIYQATFTPEGHLSYELGPRDTFNFRYLETVADEGEAPSWAAEQQAAGRAEEKAKAWLTEHGYGFKSLRAGAAAVATTPLGKRQRQAAAREQRG